MDPTDHIDTLLAQFAQAQRPDTGTRLTPPPLLPWRVLHEENGGILRACLDDDGHLVVQRLAASPDGAGQFFIPAHALPTLRALLRAGNQEEA